MDYAGDHGGLYLDVSPKKEGKEKRGNLCGQCRILVPEHRAGSQILRSYISSFLFYVFLYSSGQRSLFCSSGSIHRFLLGSVLAARKTAFDQNRRTQVGESIDIPKQSVWMIRLSMIYL